MTVHGTSKKKLSKNIILMPKFNFEFLRTIIKTLGAFISNVERNIYALVIWNASLFMQLKKNRYYFANFIHFQSHVTIFFNHLGTRRPHDLPFDGHALLSERLEEATYIILRLKSPLGL